MRSALTLALCLLALGCQEVDVPGDGFTTMDMMDVPAPMESACRTHLTCLQGGQEDDLCDGLAIQIGVCASDPDADGCGTLSDDIAACIGACETDHSDTPADDRDLAESAWISCSEDSTTDDCRSQAEMCEALM